MSRWLVGSSSRSMLAFCSVSRARARPLGAQPHGREHDLPAARDPAEPQAAHGGALLRRGRAAFEAVQLPLASPCFPGALPSAVAADELLRLGDLVALGFILLLLAPIALGAQVEITAVGGGIALGLPARDL